MQANNAITDGRIRKSAYRVAIQAPGSTPGRVTMTLFVLGYTLGTAAGLALVAAGRWWK